MDISSEELAHETAVLAAAYCIYSMQHGPYKTRGYKVPCMLRGKHGIVWRVCVAWHGLFLLGRQIDYEDDLFNASCRGRGEPLFCGCRFGLYSIGAIILTEISSESGTPFTCLFLLLTLIALRFLFVTWPRKKEKNTTMDEHPQVRDEPISFHVCSEDF